MTYHVFVTFAQFYLVLSYSWEAWPPVSAARVELSAPHGVLLLPRNLNCLKKRSNQTSGWKWWMRSFVVTYLCHSQEAYRGQSHVQESGSQTRTRMTRCRCQGLQYYSHLQMPSIRRRLNNGHRLHRQLMALQHEVCLQPWQCLIIASFFPWMPTVMLMIILLWKHAVSNNVLVGNMQCHLVIYTVPLSCASSSSFCNSSDRQQLQHRCHHKSNAGHHPPAVKYQITTINSLTD